MADPSTLLCTLSTDALAHTSRYLTDVDVSRLWMCGDKRVNAKLAAHGVVETFHVIRPLSSPTFWPSIIRYFPKTTVFRLNMLRNYSLSLKTEHILQLPGTLCELEFRYLSDAFRVFREVLALQPQLFPSLESLRIDDVSTNNPVGPGRKGVNWPSSLTSLTLNVSDDLDLGELPAGLFSLSARIMEVLNSSLGFPSSLHHLDIELLGSLPLPIESLPAGLKALTLDHVPTRFPYYDWDLTKLPQGMTSLAGPFPHTQRTVESLPAGLTFLELPPSPDADTLAQFLPPMLKSAGIFLPRFFWT